MAGLAFGQVLRKVKEDGEWDPHRWQPRYDSDTSDDDDDDVQTTGPAGPAGQARPPPVTTIPIDWLNRPSMAAATQAVQAAQAAGAAAAARAAASRAAGPAGPAPRPRRDPNQPPPELFNEQSIGQPIGYHSDWGDVSTALEYDLGEQEREHERAVKAEADVREAKRLGLRQASLKEHETIRTALETNRAAGALNGQAQLNVAQEAANAFLWSHNIVSAENNVVQQSLLRSSYEGSNPYCNYQDGADSMYVFAMPTTGDNGTLENDFQEIVPDRKMQQRKGVLIDPRTNLVSYVYEDLPPPANGDWSTPAELRDPERDNRHFVRLMGGYDAHNPPPPRREWEAEAPVPESTNGDAAYALRRREMQYRQVTSEVANNKNMMAPESEIDRHAVGYVGYQNETPYADLVGRVPATLRGYPGSEVDTDNRPVLDFTAFGPNRTVASAALDCGSLVGTADRSKPLDRALPTPVGLHELRFMETRFEDTMRSESNAMTLPMPYNPIGAATRAAPVAPRTGGEFPTVRSGAPTAAWGASAAAIGATQWREDLAGDARPAEAGRAVAGPTRPAVDMAAAGGRELPAHDATPWTRAGLVSGGGPGGAVGVPVGPMFPSVVLPGIAQQVSHSRAGHSYTGADGGRVQPEAQSPNRRDLPGFPTGITQARHEAGRVQPANEAHGLERGVVQPREWTASAAAQQRHVDAGHEAASVAGAFSDPRRYDDNAVGRTGATAGPTQPAPHGLHGSPLRADAHGGAVGRAQAAVPAPQYVGAPMDVHASREFSGHASLPHAAVSAPQAVGAPMDVHASREFPAVVPKPGAPGGLAASAVPNAERENVRAKNGVALGPMRGLFHTSNRDISRHGRRITPGRSHERPERVVSPRTMRRDVVV